MATTDLIYNIIAAIVGAIIGILVNPLKKRFELNERGAEERLKAVYRPLYSELSTIKSELSSPGRVRLKTWLKRLTEKQYRVLLINGETWRALRRLVFMIEEYNLQIKAFEYMLEGILARKIADAPLLSIRKRIFMEERYIGGYRDLLGFFIVKIFNELFKWVVDEGQIDLEQFKRTYSDFVRDFSEVVAHEPGLSGEELLADFIRYINNRLNDKAVARMIEAVRELREEILEQIELCQELIENDIERLRAYPFFHGAGSFVLIEKLKSEQGIGSPA